MYENSHDQNSRNDHSQSRTNWLPWMLAAGMGILLLFNYFGGSLNSPAKWLPSLMTLICPLMMLFMMLGHRHGQSHNGSDNENNAHGGCCHSPKSNKTEAE